MRVFNFSAGPAACLCLSSSRRATKLLDWKGGMSVMEVSHRSPAFIAVAERAESDLRELLGIPPTTACSSCRVAQPRNFRPCRSTSRLPARRADYLNTGHWSERAIRRPVGS